MDWDDTSRNSVMFPYLDWSLGTSAGEDMIAKTFSSGLIKNMIEGLNVRAKQCAAVNEKYTEQRKAYQYLARRKEIDKIRERAEDMKDNISSLMNQLKALEKTINASDRKIRNNVKKISEEIYDEVDIVSICLLERLDELFYRDEIVDIINNRVSMADIKKLSFDSIKYLFKSLEYNIEGVNQDKLNAIYTVARDFFVNYIGNVTDKKVFNDNARESVINEAKLITGIPESFIKDITNKFDSMCVLYAIKNNG